MGLLDKPLNTACAGFLKLLLSRKLVHMCVSAPRASIATHVKCICNNQLHKPFPQLFCLFMALTINKMNGYELSNNTERCEHLPLQYNSCHRRRHFKTGHMPGFLKLLLLFLEIAFV